ncbi:hypothetical protein LX36DRAFT_144915 [Colletotrichum falcatum]|nr:hypothetical protein LX36DRAFT_144915 [Colletotrichum falcatum]
MHALIENCSPPSFRLCHATLTHSPQPIFGRRNKGGGTGKRYGAMRCDVWCLLGAGAWCWVLGGQGVGGREREKTGTEVQRYLPTWYEYRLRGKMPGMRQGKATVATYLRAYLPSRVRVHISHLDEWDNS